MRPPTHHPSSSHPTRGPSIQDSAAMDSLQLLSVDEAKLVKEGGQDDGMTKAWRSCRLQSVHHPR